MITRTAGVSPVRLIHPDPETAHHDSRLARLGWSGFGRDVLGPEAVFAVELTSASNAVRGVVAVWDVADAAGSGGLLPHEETDARAVRRRVRALRSAHVDRDPLLLTHRGGGTVGALLRGRTSPVYERVERDRHVVVSQVERERGEQVLAELRGGRYLVADGHHRLAAATALRREGTAAQVTALVVDADETPLSLGAIHRVLLDEVGREHVDDRVVQGVLDRCRAAGAQVTPAAEHPDSTPAPGHELVDSPVVRSGVSLVHGDRTWAVTWPHHPRTDVTTLVEHVLDDTDGTRTRREPDADLATASARRGAMTVLLPAPDLDDVLGLAARGVLLPYKATSFEPKLPSGSLVRPLAAWTADHPGPDGPLSG